MTPIGPRLRRLLARLALGLLVVVQPASAAVEDGPTLAERDAALIAEQVRALPRQVPDRVDLYAIGLAGDGAESVFRNEVQHLRRVMDTRFHAGAVTLVNHPDSFGADPEPLATSDNLRTALHGIASVMDVEEDVLFLFMTTHGLRDGRVILQMPPFLVEGFDAKSLRSALDASGIRHRVVVVSACYSGRFVRPLRNADTLVITAAHRNRTSFGCGSDSDITYFGRAFLVDGLNHSTDFIAAFKDASAVVAQRERKEDFRPSLPQIDVGDAIDARLQAWRSTLKPGPAVGFAPPAANGPAASISSER